ncbi:MAG: 50S ribosomal protein L22 [Clostridiales bacterium]
MKVLTKKERKELGIGKDQGKAILSYARISARKAKSVIDLIKGKDLDVAYGILKNTRRDASTFLLKLVKSAEANALMNLQADTADLYIAEAYANQGPTLKRIMPRAQGRANRIRKRTSHLTVVVKEKKL